MWTWSHSYKHNSINVNVTIIHHHKQQWRSQVYESEGVHGKLDLLTGGLSRITSAVIRESLAGNPGPFPSPRKKFNLRLAKMQFSSVLWGLHALFSLFLVDILPRYQFLTTPPHHPHNFYANLDKLRNPYFQKWGKYRPPDPSWPRQWHAHYYQLTETSLQVKCRRHTTWYYQSMTVFQSLVYWQNRSSQGICAAPIMNEYVYSQ